MQNAADEILQNILEPLSRATLSIAKADDLEALLQQIADVSRTLISAQYAAIGVPNDEQLLDLFVFSGMDTAVVDQLPHLPRGLGLLGAILHEHRTIRIADIAQDSRSIGFPDGHPPMSSFLGTPIISDGQTIGSLYLTNKLNHSEFSILDEKLVEILAAHAAIAFKKGRLYKLSQQHKEQLEALNEAALSISGKLDLHKVLQQIVDSVREITGAQYAALGVPNNHGLLDEFIYSGMMGEEAKSIKHLPRGHGMLGAIIHEKKTIRISHLANDTRSVGFPENHPPMDAFLGVPILAGEQLLGNLYLTNKTGGNEFTAADQDLVEKFAVHAAIAIQNAKLYEEVGRLAVVEERTRIGMDLHDGIIQSIYAVGLILETTKTGLSPDDLQSNQFLDRALVGLNDAIRDIRNYILDLRPLRFSGDLQTGLSRLVNEFQANTLVPVQLNLLAPSVNSLSPTISRTIFLSAQEGLANVARHAKAAEVFLSIEETKTAVILKIVDDGQGFDTRDKAQKVGHGLVNMQRRAETLNGEFEIQSAKGQGTTIILTLPFK